MDDDPPSAAAAAAADSARPKRRRIAVDSDDDDDDNGDRRNDNNDNPEGGAGTDDEEPADDDRRSRLERRAAERRRLREQQNESEAAAYPGDDAYDALNRTTAVDDDGGNNDDGDDAIDDPEDHDTDLLDYSGANAGGADGILDGPYDPEEDEGEGEDLLENALRDYQRIDALDTYGRDGIDDRDYADMDVDQRRAAEAVLAEREQDEMARRGGGTRQAGFYGALDAFEVEEEEGARAARRGQFGGRRRGLDRDDEGRPDDEDMEEEEDDEDEDNFEDEEGVNLEAFDVPLREWIAQDRTRKEIQRKFRVFLSTFVEDDDDEEDDEDGTRRRKRKARSDALYEQKIKSMCASNRATLEVSYLHLMAKEPTLAIWIADAPRDMMEILNESATKHALRLFPSYHAIQDEIHVRVSDVPILDSLRDLRRSHLDCLVKVSGVVTRRTGVYPQLKMAYYDCVRCRYTAGPFRVEESSTVSTGPADSGNKDAASLHAPGSCPSCQGEGPFKLNAVRTQYRNYQRVNLQESPGSVPPGRVPRTKEVVLTNDLIDAARPGEEVEITGVYCHSYDYHLTQRSGFPVFQTFVVANHVRKKEDASSAANLSESDRAQILELASDPNIGNRIVDSIAPSIHGHRHVKMALAMSLFGAVPKNVDDKHRIRGDVNVLLLGDPGTAKSQMLKYAEQTAPRAVYSTGKGASAVGLTASVHKDPLTREWTLEGGALVLADRGVCLIDEFDKMNEQDRTSIHEAMEQQSISVSKAGIVTSLQARCSVIAAANPIGGRYDSSCTLAENVELTDPILQRFDCLCVLQDVVDPVADERLATFVTGSHMRSVPTVDVVRGTAVPPPPPSTGGEGGGESSSSGGKKEPIPQALLRKYIQYARANVRPVLRGGTFDQEKIASLYVALRKESTQSGGVPVAVRHIESIMRMAEAHAKMHLREYVRDDDVDASIGMMLESFISAQKFSVRRSLRRNFAKFLSTGEDRAHLLLHILQDMMRNEAMYQTIKERQQGRSGDGTSALDTLEVPVEEFESRARDRRIYDVSEFCRGEAFREAGYTLDENRMVIMRSH